MPPAHRLSDDAIASPGGPAPSSTPPGLFFARQPIFTTRRAIWGYELLYRQHDAADRADYADIDWATLRVTAGACQGSLRDLRRGAKILVNFSVRTLLEGLPFALPAETTIIEISESAVPNALLLAALAEFKKAGYGLAVDDFQGQPDRLPLTRLADAIIIDCLERDRPGLVRLVDAASQAAPAARLLAKRVETEDSHALVRTLGFSLVQGFFFKRPEIVPDRRLASAEASRLRLLGLIQDEAAPPGLLVEVIRTDPALSYRLLRYLNFAVHDFPERIRSVERAATHLGDRQLRNWLRVIILADISASSEAEELCRMAAQRARFLELAGARTGRTDADPGELFLLGLFSLLDAMLRAPMAEILDILPLDDDLAAALLERTGRLAPWLDLVLAFETAEWSRLYALLDRLRLDPLDAAASYAEAMAWTGDFFHQAGRGRPGRLA